MSINTNIDGVNTTVDTPTVNIDGTWKTVNTVKHNIDGVWKQSYPEAYKINLYIYGELYDTLYCNKGSSVTLPTVDTVYEDETAHYGWTTTEGSTSRNYAATASITPTADTNLYAVFSYSAGTTVGTKSIGCAASTTYSGTIEVSGTLTLHGSYTTTTTTSNGVTTPTYHSGGYTLYINGTKVSGGSLSGGDTYSYSVSKGDTYKVVVGTYKIDKFTIPAYVAVTKYRSTI